jgi:hypothetical protein
MRDQEYRLIIPDADTEVTITTALHSALAESWRTWPTGEQAWAALDDPLSRWVRLHHSELEAAYSLVTGSDWCPRWITPEEEAR